MIGRIAGVTGRVLLTAGILLLLFSAYQVWGTWLLEAHTQDSLRHKLSEQLPAGALAQAERLANRPAFVHPKPAPTDQAAPTTAPPPTGTPVGIIDIPSIGLDQVVVEGVATADLRKGPGHYPTTPLPGQVGNAAIAGHRTTYGHPFYDLNAVVPGARVVLTTVQGTFVYAAASSLIVSPTDTSVVAPTPDATLTLTTCNPRYSALQRLVLHATLVSSSPFTPASAPHPPAPPKKQPTTARPSPRRVERAATGLAGGGGGDWVPALLWGLGLVALAVAVREAARRTRRRLIFYVPGAIALLVVLFYFFTAVTPLLPASF